MTIHRRVDADDCTLHDGAILELNRDLLSIQLLEKLDQLHSSVLSDQRAPKQGGYHTRIALSLQRQQQALCHAHPGTAY